MSCCFRRDILGHTDSDQWRRRCYGNPARAATQNRSPAAETSQTKPRRHLCTHNWSDGAGAREFFLGSRAAKISECAVFLMAARVLTGVDGWWDQGASSRGCYLTGDSIFSRPDNHARKMGGKRSATYRGILMASGAHKRRLLLKLTYLRSPNPHPASSSQLRRPSAGIPAAHAHTRVGSQRLIRPLPVN